MPWYKVDYACPLNLSQMDEIATAITNIHSQHFKTPKIFVNVRVKDISTANVYVGGRKVSSIVEAAIIFKRARQYHNLYLL